MKDKSRTKRKSEWQHLKQNGEYLLLFLPGAFHIFLFGYLPMIGIIIAFKNFRYDKGIWGSEWIGFRNFEFLFTSSTAYRIFRNTLLYEAGYLALTTVVALAFAILLNEISRKWLRIYQTPLFLPYFLSWVVVSYLTYALLDHQMGFVNKTFESIGLKPVMWYLDANVWPFILNIVALWKNIGFATLVYFAGIVGISPEYYESAKLDGASRWKMATKITIPMLTPLIVILIILAIGNIMKGDFGLHYFIPGNSGMVYPTTDIIDTYVYRALIELGDIGMSSSVGVFQSVVGLVLVIVTNYIVRKINEENALW